MKKATAKQIEIARKFHIPVSQAHTINLDKVKAYQEYLDSGRGIVDRMLDDMHVAHLSLNYEGNKCLR